MNPNQRKIAASAAMRSNDAARAAAVAWRARKHSSTMHGDDFGGESLWLKIKAFFGFKPKLMAATAPTYPPAAGQVYDTQSFASPMAPAQADMTGAYPAAAASPVRSVQSFMMGQPAPALNLDAVLSSGKPYVPFAKK